MLSTNPPVSIPKSNRVLKPVSPFIGRGDELNAIVSILTGSMSSPTAEKRVLIRGSVGGGKTELCRAVAHQVQQEFPDAQIYISLDSQDSVHLSRFKTLETIIHIFDPGAQISEDPDVLYKHYLSVLSGKQVLIILDDLRNAQFLDLLLPPSSCALLITTSEDLEIPEVRSFPLSSFSHQHAEQLLVSICPRIGKSADSLAHFCQHLPLSLSLVAGYLSHQPELRVDDFILEFAKHAEQSRDPDENSIDEIVTYIVEHLNSEERTFLLQLAILGHGFSRELIRELKALEINHVEKHLLSDVETFVILGILTYDEEHDFYRMQSVVQEIALMKLGETAEAPYELGKTFASFTSWFSTLAHEGADRYLLSVMVFDEHKATIKNILRYLRKHPTAVGDQTLLDFFDLIRLFGYSRLATNVELIPLLLAMVESAIRLRDKDKLGALIGYLSETYQRLEDEEHASQYSKLQEDLTQQEDFKVIAEYFRNSGSLKPWNVESQEQVASDLLIPALEEFATKKTKIILTGFMGTGKTTVGKLLADHLKYRFIDTDELIESRNHRSISDIFEELGEEAFREMERAIVKELAELDDVVVSTGGRLMLDPENVSALSHNSRVLCLVATPDEILTRVLDDAEHKRPLLTVPNPKQRIVDLLQERNDKYRRFPQIITDEKKPTDIAKGLVEFINTSPKSLTIENPQKSYEYVVGAGLLPFIRQLAGIDGEVVIITDEVVRGLYGPSCSSIGHIIEIPSGRQHKSLATVQSVYDELLDKGFDRSGTVIALGGSVVGDVAGYVAATYMRGVDFVQCPTSLIAMVDTSVGGKTSLDLPQGKNMIGVYKQPTKVIADVATLQTLHQVDFASGMAEVIKHGLIAESNLLEQVEQGHWAKNWDRSPSYIGDLQRLVAQAIQVKINIVQADPFEQGQRSILNLGHTFGYAIEQVSNNAYRHGEAVSMGLVAAANLSARLGYCDISLQRRVEQLLEIVSLPTRIPSQIKPDAILQAMQHDKKKRAGLLRFILLRGIGQPFVSEDVSAEEVKDTVFALAG